MGQIRESVIAFISNNFIVNMEELDENDSLVEKGIIDSIGIISIITYIEEKYDIRIKDHEVTLSNFGSIRSIVEYIQKVRK